MINSNNFKETPNSKPFGQIFNELSLTKEGLILRGTRFLLPEKLYIQAISLAHEGHQGYIKTKQLLRSSVWFPKMDKFLMDFYKQCTCQAVIDSNNKAPLKVLLLPKLLDDLRGSSLVELAKVNDMISKSKMKKNADKNIRIFKNNLTVGDLVLVKQKQPNKSVSIFDPAPYRITEIKGTMVTATRQNNTITRNISLFKKYYGQTSKQDEQNRRRNRSINIKSNVFSEVFMEGEFVENIQEVVEHGHDNNQINMMTNVEENVQAENSRETESKSVGNTTSTVQQSLVNVNALAQELLEISRLNNKNSFEINNDGTVNNVPTDNSNDRGSIAIQATITLYTEKNGPDGTEPRKSKRLADKPKPHYNFTRKYGNSNESQ
ncbi:unnamed protein product [Brachionus calyciflorus]|uniref:Integrase zinc-binding domain-containing protein n=1 Tax=Brachionus calyciflorus TaxID=104777 RepID=A0A814BK60_9BILA|nr:unnamed protein product [Brachionus calyciflorus]